MRKYDGWTLKVSWAGREPYLIPGLFHYDRSGVIKDFEGSDIGSWRRYRRKGIHKIVKVKMVEVSND